MALSKGVPNTRRAPAPPSSLDPEVLVPSLILLCSPCTSTSSSNIAAAAAHVCSPSRCTLIAPRALASHRPRERAPSASRRRPSTVGAASTGLASPGAALPPQRRWTRRLGEGPDEHDGVLQQPLVPCRRLDPTSCSWCGSTQIVEEETYLLEIQRDNGFDHQVGMTASVTA